MTMIGVRLRNHEHQIRWEMRPVQPKVLRGGYVWIRVWFDCGCGIGDTAGNDIDTFAAHMRVQRGWDIATTVGWSYGPVGGIGTYSVRVRRKSLERK